MKPLATILIALAALTAQAADDFTGKVIRVSDGDTYVVERADNSTVKVRLHCVDCPELSHRRLAPDQPGGRAAADYAAKLILDKSVTVHPRGESYGRIVADVAADANDIGHALLASGNAWCDPRYKPTPAYAAAEADARKNKLGIWSQDKPIPPWEWRATERVKLRERKR